MFQIPVLEASKVAWHPALGWNVMVGGARAEEGLTSRRIRNQKGQEVMEKKYPQRPTHSHLSIKLGLMS